MSKKISVLGKIFFSILTACVLGTVPFRSAADAAALCPNPTGGVAEGVIDCGQISVVTLNLATFDESNTIATMNKLYSVYRAGHGAETDRDFIVTYMNTSEMTGLGGVFWRVDDAIAPVNSVGVASILQVYTSPVALGISRLPAVLSHEVGHHWMALESNGLPSYVLPKIKSGTTTAGGTAGLLTDATANFSNIEVGDRIVFPVAQGIKRFPITAKTATTLTFGNGLNFLNDPYHTVTVIADTCPTNSGQSFTPAAATSYFVESWDLIGRSCAHWEPKADTDASFLDGIEWQDNGNGTFTSLAEEEAFSLLELYIMGLIQTPSTELPASVFRLKNLNPDQTSVGSTVSATKRSFTRAEVQAWKTIAYNPRNFRTRFMIATSVGKSVAPESIDRIDETRRLFALHFQDETLQRSKLIHNFDETKADLVAADIIKPEKIGLGEALSVTVRVHNQSAQAVGVNTQLKWETPWTNGQITVAPLAAFEVRNVVVNTTVPATESAVFNTQAYRASLKFKATVDFTSQVTEADEDHNIREVDIPWKEAIGNILTLPQKSLGIPPVVDGRNVFVLRLQASGPFHEIVQVNMHDPLNPTTGVELPISSFLNDIVAGNGIVGVSHFLLSDKLELYVTPVAANSVPIQTLSNLEVDAMTMYGSRIYIANGSGLRVVTGVSSSGTAQLGNTAAYSGADIPNPAIPRHIVVSPNGQKLFVLLPYGADPDNLTIQQFSLTNPDQPTFVRRFDFPTQAAIVPGTILKDFDVSDGFLYAVQQTGITSYNTSNGQTVTSLPPNGEELSKAELNGEFLFVRTSGYWTIYESPAANGTLTRVGSIPVGNITDTFLTAGATTFGGWTILLDTASLRFVSARSVIHTFLRGDSNADNVLNITDAVRILDVLFGPESFLGYQDAFDADDSETVDISDSVRVLNFLFSGGAPPAAPYPTEGVDPAGTALGYVEPRP